MKCPHGYKCIPGNGPMPCRIFCIAEAPGKVEEHTLIPLTGPTGMEFNDTYLPLAGLRRDRVYVTNTVKHCSTINRKPTVADIEMCTRCCLKVELNEVRPDIVLLMGATACNLIPEIDLEVEHGIPRIGTILNWSGWVVPMYHPALGLHETSKMGMLLDDWTGLKGWLKDPSQWGWTPDILYGQRNYTLARAVTDVEKYFAAHNTPYFIELIAVDSETHGTKEYSLQISRHIGTGLMVLESDHEAMSRLVRVVRDRINYGAEIIFHNAPADLDVLTHHLKMFGMDGFKFRDTMQEAYQLGLPQGLKALSYRLLGRKRKSWEETITPASKDVLRQWIVDGIVVAQRELTIETPRRSEKTGRNLKPHTQKSVVESALTSILGHMERSDEYDPWKKLRERLSPMYMEWLEGELGLAPVKGIAHCTLQDQIEYGCADADDTLAVALELERIREGKVGQVQEEDWDR